ncbi:MAG: C25 family cysteine peptidase [Aureispira sp.]
MYNKSTYWSLIILSKIGYCLLGFLFLSHSSFGQGHDGLFGNEWIDYSPGKQYYKIRIANDGWYRLPASVLQQAGAPISSINTAGLQLFHQGQEVPLQVEENNGTLSYVQFYGKKNRGAFDVHCYNDADQHFNEYYSLYNDTSTYFLTWGATASTEHFTDVAANLSNLPAKEEYFLHESRVVYQNIWNEGLTWRIATELLTKSTFEYGEGYGSDEVAVLSTPVPTPFAYNNGPDAIAAIKLFTKGIFNHNINIQSNNNVYGTHTFNGSTVDRFTANFPASILQNITNVTLRETTGGSNRYFVAYAELTYPRLFNFNGQANFAFKMAAHANRKSLEITNINASNASQNRFYLYDLTNKLRIQCFYDAGNARLLTDLTPSTQDREMVFVNEGTASSFIEILAVSAVVFRDFGSSFFTPTNYIIITHPQLERDAAGNNPIFDYRAYRQSAAGGSYVTAKIDIQELYDQFAYGINTHPLAIRHFAHFAKRNWINPEYLYLIGKGRIYRDIRTNPSNMLLPTFGYPPSDQVLAASISTDEPSIAIGRLSATTGEQVRTYLQKIIDVEAQRAAPQTLGDLGWTKNILHLGGGQNSIEQNRIRTHLNTMKTIIEGPSYGGEVQSFFKTSTNPIQSAQSLFLDSLINSGVSMLTFFGHSSSNSFDFNLDHPRNYSNYQKYPLMLALGCYGGTMFEQGMLISEDFIFEPQAGAGVFLASSSAASLDGLNQFGRQFYNSINGVHYGEGAAKSAKRAIGLLEDINYPITVQMACHYMVYHGDPAYKASTAQTPDYYIDNSLVGHSPNVVTVQMNTFDLELDVYNLGKAIDTTFNVRVERTFPDGSRAFVAVQRVQAPHFTDRIVIPIPVGNVNALGINYFDVYIDSDLEIDEAPNPAAENNNQVLRYAVAIVSDAIVPIYPHEFAILPQAPITLKASTGNVFALSQTYALQIDTTAYFNSPLLQQTTLTQAGGLVEWTPSTTYLDSTVYYWRVSIDSTNSSVGYNWSQSSFIYINGSYPGWNQSHFFQYLRDEQTSLSLQEPDRKFNFITSIQEVAISTALTPSVSYPENIALYLNGSKLDKCHCSGSNGMYLAVIEPGTLNFWELPGGGTAYGAVNCDPAIRPSELFLFNTNTSVIQDSLANFIENVVPNGHYVVAFSLNNASPTTWNQRLIDAFEDEGAWYIQDWINNSTLTSAPQWATFFKKGDTTYIHKNSVLGASVNDIVELSGRLEEDWYQGSQTSTLIGPVSNWGAFYWNTEFLPNDLSHVQLYALDANRSSRVPFFGNLTALNQPLSSIDANQYPYLELVWNTLDSVDQTPAQLDYWRITADMVPEAALRPDLFLFFDSSCVQRGQDLTLSIALENISAVDMDSMLVRFEILGTNKLVYKRLAPVAAGDTLHASVSFETEDLTGSQYQLLVEINPNNDQREQFQFNNVGLLSFKVRQDIINPLLDVTFDGMHIMNKDIVSGTPEIVVSLSDENPYLGLDELENFSLILRHPSFPNGEMFLSPATTDLQFYPANLGDLEQDNTAKIILHPDLQADGLYTLFVSANDKSGNNSGELSYSVDFEVINKPSITHLLNYPNPFSTSTQFVFTLTGRELPDYMKIQILTVTGKIVREIGQEELGPLRIGINRTDYAWDGRDEYGDQLANGVYLYRVITKRNGQEYELRSTRNDYMFRQGFGKMYLMR